MPKLIAGRGQPDRGKPGLVDVCGTGDGLERLSLQIAVVEGGAGLEGTAGDISSGREMLLVPLDGTAVATVSAGGGASPVCCALSRLESVGVPTAVAYVPPGAAWSVRADTGPARLALVSCRMDRKADMIDSPVLITGNTMKTAAVGRENWAREVRTYTAGVPTSHLVAGETVHLVPGGWSSFPPHKHDTRSEDGEQALEEVYFYRCKPASGFGVQLVYGPGMDFAARVREGDCVVIDRGYHPVSAAPGTIIWYLWALAGEGPELGVSVDPDFV